ncbi:MAG: SH3 domain-containing protein [Anaerolineae bacterium]|nr:SH3 domain-containing protein [Anaerolineae bacterium]
MGVKRCVRTGLLLAVLFGAGLLSGCMNIYATPTLEVPTATLAPLATFTPRYTATPVPSSTPSATLTVTSSATPISPTPSDTPTPTATPPTVGQVSSQSQAVNLREGPGTAFAAIEGVPNNSEVIILATDESEAWYNVRLESGTEGWISATLVYVQPSPTPLPTNTVPGVVLEVSGTPLATALLGGAPITATPSDTPTIGVSVSPNPVSVTPTITSTGGAGLPTETATPTSGTAAPTGSPTPRPTFDGTVGPPRLGYDVLAFCEQSNDVPPPPPLAAGSTIDVFWGWIASTPNYVQQHVGLVTYEVRFDGELLENWRRYATDVSQLPDGNWAIFWYIPITEPLTAGTHTITYRVTWSDAVYDGYDWYGPGTENEVEIGNCTVEVR